MKFRILMVLCLAFMTKNQAQNLNYAVGLIPENLQANVNSVVRNQKIEVTISSISKMNIKTYKAVTVFNKHGFSNIDAIEYYNKSRNVNSIEAVIYNQYGYELKKLKRKDFLDYTVAGDAADITDTRVLQLNYVPTEFPFTIVYESEVTTSNTAFLPKWYPMDDFEESVQKSEFTITYPIDLGFKYKELYFENNMILEKKTLINSIAFKIENLEAKRYEEMSSYKLPNVIFGLDKFSLEGVEGTAKNWEDLGKWIYSELLTGTTEIPEETRLKIQSLTNNVLDPIEKAKIVYKYMQDKTRYVSIQLGIGGWKPMLAKNVDRLGYGDCKALSNYTKSLLDAVGVKSYYVVLYGGAKIDMLQDFASLQGNHAILAIPNNGKYSFLECTSQREAFGFEGNFTDDRFALVVKPEGGEIVKTTSYENEQNSQLTTAKAKLDENGNLTAIVDIKYKGIQYAKVSDEAIIPIKELKENLKERYSYLNNLTIDDCKIKNDKEKIEFTESLNISVTDYIKKIGDEWIFIPNIFNMNNNVPKRYRSRKTGFEITSGFYDEDTVEIELPITKTINFKPEKIEIENKFGKYYTEIIALPENKIKYSRKLLIKKGKYNSDEYELYRQFSEQISRNDNSKIILK